MNQHSIAPFIKEFYPSYYSIETYPVHQCAAIRKVSEEWGVLSNFGHTPITVNGLLLKTSEQLFQLMKFKDTEPLMAVYLAANPKYPAKRWETTHRRYDWGSMIVDAMKFCLMQKYEQSEVFRAELAITHKLFIVEDQTSFRKKHADTWGVKRQGYHYVGPNLLGRLLMELRDQGRLDFSLPDGALDFTETIIANTRTTHYSPLH